MKTTTISILTLVFCFFSILHPADGVPQDFPSRTIEMVVPFKPGGTLDIGTRIVTDQLSRELKSSVAVINKPGATGTIGSGWVAKANADGHILLAGTVASLVLSNFFLDNVPFDTQKDFVPIAYAAESPSLLVVPSTSPYKTFKELIAYGKANPGKLSYAVAGGLGSTSSMNMELIKRRTGIDLARIVYQGGGPARTAVIGGHVDMTSAGYAPLRAHIKSGKLRPLATSKKIEAMPDVPTFAEEGYPEVLVVWIGFFAPAQIPSGPRKILVEALERALKDPGTIQKLKNAGYVPETKTPEEFSEQIKQQYEMISQIVKETKIGK